VNIRLLSIGIIKLFEGIFYADLVLSNGSSVSSRTSDAVALAVRTGAKIEVTAEILHDAGVAIPDED
jgi:bifunctional DNase/RNase